uniref:Uncharacterized protein n=1 Tax=Arundo donax TaxID=35708 RepID=A0A0A9G2H7_ARUDO
MEASSLKNEAFQATVMLKRRIRK